MTEKNPQLFDDPVLERSRESKRVAKMPYHAQMLAVYGRSEGHKCGDCAFLLEKRMGNTYLKCSKSKVTGGPGTDWRKGWEACGLFHAGRIPPMSTSRQNG